MKDMILTIDLGTSTCKANLFTPDGLEVARETASYTTRFPRADCAEQDPEEWWQCVVETVRAIGARNPSLATSLQAIVVTGQMHGLVCVDEEGRSMYPCLTLHDQRSLREVGQLRDACGEQAIYHVTGERLSPSLPVAKLLWLRGHEPDVFRNARWFLACKDYVRSRLTGNFSTDPLDAAATGLMDLADGEWSMSLCKACALPPDKLPPIAGSTFVDGPLVAEAAEALGLSPGVPVVVGAGDDVEVIGAGLAEPGMVLEHIGTTGSLLMCTDSMAMSWESGLELYPHLLPNMWILGGSTSSAGAALKWATEALALRLPEDLTLEELDPTHSLQPIFLPYLAGERSPVWAPEARGAFIGLALSHNRADIIRSVYEGVACSLRHMLDALGDLGVRPNTIRVAGDSTLDGKWRHIRASLYELPLLELTYPDPTAHGAMALGAVAVGIDDNLLDTMRRIVRVQATLAPVEEMSGYYGRLYERYLHMSDVILSMAQSDAGVHPKDGILREWDND